MARPTPLPTRAAFFEREMASWKALGATWCGLSDDAMTAPCACGHWSVKDAMNHIAAWQEAAVQMIEKLQRGKWASLGLNTQRFNDQHYALDRGRTLAATRRRLNASRRALLALLQDVPSQMLLNEFGRQAIGWWAKWTTYGHYEQHLHDLQLAIGNPSITNSQ